ncbi:MAG: hypothetical protein WD981_04890 [Gaiellaceae bacterium]
MGEPIVDREDVYRIQFLLTDILKEVKRLVELLEDDGGEEEETEEAEE